MTSPPCSPIFPHFDHQKCSLPLSPSHTTPKAKRLQLSTVPFPSLHLEHSLFTEQELANNSPSCCTTFLVSPKRKSPVWTCFVHVFGTGAATKIGLSPSKAVQTRKYACWICLKRHPSSICLSIPTSCSRCMSFEHKAKACPLMIEEIQKVKEKWASMKIIPSSCIKGKLLTPDEKHMAARVYYELLAETATDFISTKSAFQRTYKYTVCWCGNRAGVSSGGVLGSQGTLEKTTITSIQTQDRIWPIPRHSAPNESHKTD